MCVQGRSWLPACRLKIQFKAPATMRPQRFGSFHKTFSPRPESLFEGSTEKVLPKRQLSVFTVPHDTNKDATTRTVTGAFYPMFVRQAIVHERR